MMDWFRLYHGTCTDAKLSLAKAYSGLPRPYVIAAWVAVLEHASSREERGSVDGLSAELLAVTIDCSVDEAGKLLDAFERAGMLCDGRVASWEKRQPSDPTAAERMRRLRARRRSSGSCDADDAVTGVTDAIDTVTRRNAAAERYDQIREEQNRDSPPLPSLRSGSSPPRGEREHAVAPDGAPADSNGGCDPPPKSASARKSRNGSRLPPDWTPSEDDLRFAAGVGLPPERVHLEAERFRDYWTAQTGQRARKADWRATWRNWCRKAADELARLNARSPPSVVRSHLNTARAIDPWSIDDDEDPGHRALPLCH